MEKIKDKTWKREFAAVLFVWLVYLVYTDDKEMVDALATYIFIFFYGAFGLDGIKQLR
jgi:hypothetical protein